MYIEVEYSLNWLAIVLNLAQNSKQGQMDHLARPCWANKSAVKPFISLLSYAGINIMICRLHCDAKYLSDRVESLPNSKSVVRLGSDVA